MFTDPIVVELGGYEIDIAPILKALASFVQKILEFYLPEDVSGALKEFEEME